jgi:hypothetical protein
MMFGIGAIDALYRDRERAAFRSLYPAFFFQIPDVEFQMLSRTA